MQMQYILEDILKRSENIMIRVEPELKKQIQRLAESRHVSMSHLICETMRERVGNRKGRK